MKRNSVVFSVWIVVIGALLFTTGLGRVHLFDWDEINFAESAREMLVSGDYLDVQINFETFWEKPPLFIWMQAFSMKLFGVNEFAARFPNALAGIITLLVLFFIGKRLRDESFGLLWSLLYACSFLPFFYFKSGIIDPWFNLFIFLGIYFMIRYTLPEHNDRQGLHAVLSAFFLGLATLTKGPVGFLIFALCFFVFLVLRRFRIDFRWKHVLAFIGVFAIVGGLWFILQIANGHLSIIQDFIVYQIRLFRTEDAGHGGFPFYHFIILFFGVFPASIFAVATFRKGVLRIEENTGMAHFFRWMMITLWVVLILFSIVQTKIVHYSSMCYFPITFLAAWYIDKWTNGDVKIGKGIIIPLMIVGIVVGLAAFAIPFIDAWKSLLIPYIGDEFTRGNLQAMSSWIGFEWLFGVVLIAAVILFAVFLRNRPKAIFTLLAGCLVFIYGGVFFITPQVEKYSQHAAIEFYQRKRGEDCYILPLHKSYAHYFYSDRQPQNTNTDREFLQRGAIDKPAYFVLRNQQREVDGFVSQTVDAMKLYDKNGFAFYARYPK
ncbi:ArnT family glycosyltransferase [Limibacterium fermenti]|uniref:ArnT family glycosyltransferase n=1 Tax=Limibacterium fermenti TaxID=3229863 RepID=UPI000E8266A6|nr:glycosyl transferase [Porphyromonadaceae bacterium]